MGTEEDRTAKGGPGVGGTSDGGVIGKKQEVITLDLINIGFFVTLHAQSNMQFRPGHSRRSRPSPSDKDYRIKLVSFGEAYLPLT